MKIPAITAMICMLTLLHTNVYSQLFKQYADSAKVYKEQQKMDIAIEWYSKAKEALEKDSAGTNSYAGVCASLGILYRNMGQYEKAEPVVLKAKQIREKALGRESLDYATSCVELGILYKLIGQYGKAEPLYLEAKQIQERILGKKHPDYATSCTNLGILYKNMGQYEKAESLYIEAKQIQEKVLGKEDPDYAYCCANLGILYWYMGQYGKAELVLLEAKQIQEKVLGKEDPNYAFTCTNLASLYWYMGQNEKAESLYLEAKQIRGKVLGKVHPDYARSCNNLANFYWNIGQNEKAEPLYLEAKQIWEKVLTKEHPDYANSCDNLANIYRNKGQYEKAESLLLEAKQIREKVFGKVHFDYAKSCTNLGILYEDMGLYEKAESLLLEAKQIREKLLGKLHPDYARSCTNLANLYWIEKNPEKAHSLYVEAYKSQQICVKKILGFTNETEQQSYLKLTTGLQDYFSSFSSTYPQYDHGLCYDMAIGNRNLILSSSQQLRSVMFTSKDTIAKRKYDNWKNVREQLAYWYSKPLTERSDCVKELEEQTNTLEKDLTRISSLFQKQQAQNSITWQDIQQALQPNEAAIEFSLFRYYNGKRWTDSTYYVALLLTKNIAEPLIIPLFEKRQLSNNNKALLYLTDQKVYTPYNLIWKPIEKHLQRITRVYFAPAGMLYTISLAALPLNNHEVLSDKYQLVQLTTTASIVNQSASFVNDSDQIDLYGGIQYNVDSATLRHAVAGYHIRNENKVSLPADLVRGRNLGDFLPYTEKEVNEIENLSKQKNYAITVLSGSIATEESIKALSGNGSPAVLHIATHGFFFLDPKATKQTNLQQQFGNGEVFRQSDNPLLRSGLLMAGAGAAWNGKPIDGVEDGILTAYEVANLYLPNTKLVVLSACETGLGDVEGNEGVYGLQRAFKIAGAKNLVMSLWQVGDKETSEFMQEFYKNMFTGQSISEAFYNAQTTMKNEYRNEYLKWAPWILVRG